MAVVPKIEVKQTDGTTYLVKGINDRLQFNWDEYHVEMVQHLTTITKGWGGQVETRMPWPTIQSVRLIK